MSALTAVLRMSFAVVLVFAQFVLPVMHGAGPAPSQPSTPAAPAKGQALRISQVFGGADYSYAPYTCDYIELFNSSSQEVSLAGWSVQYAAYNSASWNPVSLENATIKPNRYFLVAGKCPKPPSFPPDIPATFYINPTKAKVALASKTVAISGLSDPAVVDFVGYGAANEFEGSGPTPTPSGSTAVIRKGDGCIDTDNNAADFDAGWIGPRNSGSPAHACTDAAPAVQSTSPADGATGIPRDADVVVQFSEPVTVASNWFAIRCDLSGVRDSGSATVTNDGTAYTINPATDFYGDDACTLTLYGAAVHDSDPTDPPDTLPADVVIHFRTVPGQCTDPAYPIAGIQGSAATSPVVGAERTVEGIITGDFQGAAALSGFFLQSRPQDSDADPLTSEALFVQDAAALGDVAAGTRLRITGVVTESSGLTALGDVSRKLDCGAAELPPPVEINLPLAPSQTWEQYEGMLVQFRQPLTVSDNSGLNSHGRLRLVAGSLPRVYTQSHTPNAAGYKAWEDDLNAQTLLLDDGVAESYPDPIRYPAPGLSAGNTLRVGDVATAGWTGIADFRNGMNVIQPIAAPAFTHDAPRPPLPVRTAGNVRIAFMSLGDYFNIVDASGTRGASSLDEFVRQRDKIITALVGLDADIIAVSKLQNNGYGPGSAIADLVSGLNEASGSDYAFVAGDKETWGSDAVTVGIIYRASAVVPIGEPAIRDTGPFDQTTASPAHRAPMAQTFEEKAWGERFTVVVNEWHGRDDCPPSGADADSPDGQACWNAARTAAAEDLVDWLATDPTGSRDPDVLVLGELNAFPCEDPMDSFTAAQYGNLVAQCPGPDAITTLAGGRAGVSDHALASSSLQPQLARATVWNINAEEPSALDYQLENKSESQQELLYASDAYRSADQNPVIVDLNLLADQGDLSGSYGAAWHTGQGVWRLGATWGGADDGVIPDTRDWNDEQGEITATVNGPAGQYACLYGWLDFSDGEVEPGVEDEADGDWDDGEEVLAGVPLAPGPDQRIIFPLPADTLETGASLNMRVRLVPAPDPAVANCIASSKQVGSTGGVAPTGRADGGEVEDIVVTISPLAVNAASFVARQSRDGLIISWETVSEAGVAGFNLYRQDKGTDAWRKLNGAPIASLTPGASLGHAYQWLDVDVKLGASYVYRLEELDLRGASTSYGPVSGTLNIPTTVSVTALSAHNARWAGGSLLLTLLIVAALLLGAKR